MEQLRQVQTPQGVVSYFFVQKKIKNLNLRIGRENQIVVSVPLRVPPERADQFIRDKADWIFRVQARRDADRQDLDPMPSRGGCRTRLAGAGLRVYPPGGGLGAPNFFRFFLKKALRGPPHQPPRGGGGAPAAPVLTGGVKAR